MDILVTENTKDHKESRMPTLKKTRGDISITR